MIRLKKDNFFKTVLAAAIGAASTQLSVPSGKAADLSEDGPYMFVIWGASHTNPSDDPDSEIVEATKDSGETFDIVRAKEGTTAKAWSADDNIAVAATAGVFQEVDDAIKALILCNYVPCDLSDITVSDDVRAVVWSGTLYVAVSGVYALTSKDGASWKRITTGSTPDFYAACYGNGLFVIGGRQVGGADATLYTSPDGSTWTSRTSGFNPEDILAAAYGDGAYIIAGQSGKLSRSTDASTWAAKTSSFGTSDIHGLAHNGKTGVDSLFVAVGAGGKIATSSDGNTWTQRTSPFGTSTVHAVSYGKGMFVAVAADGKIATSTNGTDWSLETSPTTEILYAVNCDGDIFTAAGDKGVVLTSEDGDTWEQRPMPLSGGAHRGVNYAGDVMVICSESGRIFTNLRLK